MEKELRDLEMEIRILVNISMVNLVGMENINGRMGVLIEDNL